MVLTSNMSEMKTVFAAVDEFVSSAFDFIVVGGGTAGLALAARLSENDQFQVGVLEAGENKLDDPLVNVPTLYVQGLNVPGHDWTLKSIPQVGDNWLSSVNIADQRPRNMQTTLHTPCRAEKGSEGPVL